MRKGYLLFVLTAGLLVSACLLTRPTGVPPTPSVTPSETDVPTATPSPSPTPVPAPPGAGWVKNPFDLEFHTGPQDLGSGEYIVIRNKPGSQDFDYLYAGLNGQGNDLLFTVTVSPDVWLFRSLSLGISTYAQEDVFVFEWSTRDRARSGLVFVDLQNQRMAQFEAGCYARFDLLLPLTDPPHFAYTCSDGQGFGGEIWHVVAGGESIQSHQFPPLMGTTQMKWITSDLAIVFNENGVSCMMEPSIGSVNCFHEVPGWWIIPSCPISPDGKWVSMIYPDPSIPYGLVGAILPMECIEQPDLAVCEPKAIIPPTDVTFGGYGTEVSWSPDGKTLLMINTIGSNCPGSGVMICNETTIWAYDLEQESSRVLATIDRFMQLGTGPWTMDGEHFLMLEQVYPDHDYAIWLVSSTSGQMRRVASDLTGIVDVVGIFQVP